MAINVPTSKDKLFRKARKTVEKLSDAGKSVPNRLTKVTLGARSYGLELGPVNGKQFT